MSGISASWRRFTGIGRRVCHTCSDIMDNSFSYKIVFSGNNYPGVFFFTDVTFIGTAMGTNFLHFLILMSACYQVVSTLLLPTSDNAWRTPRFLYLLMIFLGSDFKTDFKDPLLVSMLNHYDSTNISAFGFTNVFFPSKWVDTVKFIHPEQVHWSVA